MSIVQEVEILTRAYAAKGGKDNRRQQVGRMLAFALHCQETSCARTLAHVGHSNVVRFWKDRTHLSDRTLDQQWRAIRDLFDLAGKKQPARPRTAAERSVNA